MNKAFRYLSIFLVVCALISWTDIAESRSAAVKVIFMKGSPKIMKANANEWTACSLDLVIDNGDRIKTLKGEALELSFAKDNSNIVRVNEEADVIVRKGEAPYSVELLNGEVMTLLRKLPERSTFEVRTPAGLSGARGTGWRSAATGERATFDAFERSIYAKGIDQLGNELGEIIVDAGWRTTLDRFEMPERLEKLSDADFERWNGWKEELSKRLGQRFEAARPSAETMIEIGVEKTDTRTQERIERKDQDNRTPGGDSGSRESSSGGGDLPR